jgi:hypothetical protein
MQKVAGSVSLQIEIFSRFSLRDFTTVCAAGRKRFAEPDRLYDYEK